MNHVDYDIDHLLVQIDDYICDLAPIKSVKDRVKILTAVSEMLKSDELAELRTKVEDKTAQDTFIKKYEDSLECARFMFSKIIRSIKGTQLEYENDLISKESFAQLTTNQTFFNKLLYCCVMLTSTPMLYVPADNFENIKVLSIYSKSLN